MNNFNAIDFSITSNGISIIKSHFYGTLESYTTILLLRNVIEDFALKEMSKSKIVQKKSIDSIKNERKFLEYLHHPLLINMQFAFETKKNLYLIMDYLSGGDLKNFVVTNISRAEMEKNTSSERNFMQLVNYLDKTKGLKVEKKRTLKIDLFDFMENFSKSQ